MHAHVCTCVHVRKARDRGKRITIALPILPYHMALSYISWFKAVVDATAKIKGLCKQSSLTSAQAVVPSAVHLLPWEGLTSLALCVSTGCPVPAQSLPIAPVSNLGLYTYLFSHFWVYALLFTSEKRMYFIKEKVQVFSDWDKNLSVFFFLIY